MKKQTMVLLAALLGGPPSTLYGAVRLVPEFHSTIQAALDSCADGDTVLVAPGHYHERLMVPNRTITLASLSLMTGDTLFIPQTILDGDSLGTVLTVAVGGLNRFILDGFTIRGGVGSLYHGGGIHFADSTDALLRNLHFTQNSSGEAGVCVYGDGATMTPFTGPRRFIMQNVRAYDNYLDTINLALFRIRANHYAEVSNLICNSANYRILSLASNDSIVVESVFSSNNTCGGAIISAGLTSYTQNSYQEYHNIHVNHTTWSGSNLVVLGGVSKGIVENLSFENNSQPITRTTRSELLKVSLYGVPSRFDNLLFRNNHGVAQGAAAGTLHRGKLWSESWVHGIITNLTIENCTLGDSIFTPWNTSNYPSMLTTTSCSLDRASFRNNCVTLTPGEGMTEWGVYGANILRFENYYSDSLYLKNVTFKNNLVIDLDDNESLPVHWANEGRCLLMKTEAYLNCRVDSLMFDENRQPNFAEELPYSGEFDDGQDVGSVMQIHRGIHTPQYNEEKFFSNIILRNNDDGGIRSHDESILHFRNVQMLNMSRQGFDLEAESVVLENVLIDGCTPFAPIGVRSEQMPLRLTVMQPSVIRNSTIINCTTPYVIMAGLTPFMDPSVPVVTTENCIFWNNQYIRFEALVAQYDLPGWDPYRPGRFNYCILQEAPDFGQDNLIDVDTLFSAEWGPPYLDSQSRAVDSGNPAIAFYDLTDEMSPRMPQWPSYGELRNDIGITGGPFAVAVDTNLVSVSDWRPQERPSTFTLGNPYPNPFNPATHIPYAMLRPMHVHLVVHNLLGQEVAVLADGMQAAGQHQVAFKPDRLASGLYLVTLEAGGRAETRSVTFIR